MKSIANPRSVLHAVQPIGHGTSEVESLLSLFCRVAVSHSTSTLALSRTIAERVKHDISPNYDWHERKISGLGESALTWSSALSALTTVEGLDCLTFLPWRNVISQNGLSILSRGQFCPQCLAEDRVSGRVPYLRLAWESAEVTVCHRHKSPLHCHCPSCGSDNVRHAAAFVVPGWCTRCGEFLGCDSHHDRETRTIEPSELWRARQVGEMLSVQHALGKHPLRQALIDGINGVIDELDGGRSAIFAARVGIAKSTVHHWLQDEGTPTLSMSLKISAQCGISLAKLLQGDFSGWRAPAKGQQLALGLLHPAQVRRAPAREIDWLDIERKLQAFLVLPTPICVLDAAAQLEVEARQLYLRANRTTRMLGERWKSYAKGRQQANIDRALPHLDAAGRDLLARGCAVTRRAIAQRVPGTLLSTVPHLFNVLRDVQDRLTIEQMGPGASS